MPFTYKQLTQSTTLLLTGILLGGLLTSCRNSNVLTKDSETGRKSEVVEVEQPPAEGGNRAGKRLYAELLKKYGEDYESCRESVKYDAGTCSADGTSGEAVKENLNIELVLDASGSMASLVGGEEKLTVAKETLTEFVAKLPAKANIALRVYGHVGSNSEQDRAKSCAGTELLYDFQTLDDAKFAEVIQSFQPTGWTPIADSLKQAGNDFSSYDTETNENVIYLISDGIETCDGDPVAAAQALNQSDVSTIVNVIGFDVDAEAAQQLRAVAQAGGVEYIEADNRSELYQIFDEKYASAWGKYDCVYGEQWSAYDKTYSQQWDRYDCIYQKAWKEYDSMYEEAWDLFDNENISQETREFITDTAQKKRNGLVEPAQEERKRVVNDAQEERKRTVDGAQEERNRIVNEAQEERNRNLDDAGQ